MFYQILFLPKVKRSKIINNKHGINPLPQEMPNEALKKISELYRIIAWCPVSPPSPTQNKNSINASNKLLKNSTWAFPIAGYFTWKLEFVSNTLWNTSNLMASQKINVIGSFNYISYRLTSFGTLVILFFFDFFLSELSNLDDSANFKFDFSFFKIFVSYEHKLFRRNRFISN